LVKAIREKSSSPLADGTVYSKRKNHCPFSVSPLKDYAAIVGEERIERLLSIAQRLKGLKLLEVNATAQGGGVAEMLYSSIPFLNGLSIEAEWKIIRGNEKYFEVTKSMHNQLQGMEGYFTPQMEKTYYDILEENTHDNFFDYTPDVVRIHDPQPLGLVHYLKEKDQSWLWRCHIDIGETIVTANPPLWDLVSGCLGQYDAALFSAAQYVKEKWPVPKFIIPPFIDPFSEKNRELSQEEITKVLDKYGIDSNIPTIVQIGRFDPWKGLDRTIATFRRIRRHKKCQLIIAGGMASDDPEGARMLAEILEDTNNDKDIHILNLPLEPRVDNHHEVNALQRAASIIMQPSTREGFGLVVTEALWKAKPVIAADVGAITLQIRDGTNGYFYQNPYQTELKVLRLLADHELARTMGQRGHAYVSERFLMPDRVADYLKAIEMTLDGKNHGRLPLDSIISFIPWYKLGRSRSGGT
jgi:trehalose synthase